MFKPSPVMAHVWPLSLSTEYKATNWQRLWIVFSVKGFAVADWWVRSMGNPLWIPGFNQFVYPESKISVIMQWTPALPAILSEVVALVFMMALAAQHTGFLAAVPPQLKWPGQMYVRSRHMTQPLKWTGLHSNWSSLFRILGWLVSLPVDSQWNLTNVRPPTGSPYGPNLRLSNGEKDVSFKIRRSLFGFDM